MRRADTRVWVTRPQPDAERWVQALRQAAWDAHALPLIRFAPPGDATALPQARAAVAASDVVIFVSPQAARALLHDGQDRALAWPAGARAWAPGPGTARVLRELGVPAACIDAPDEQAPQFDSEALWARVATQRRPGLRVLLVRGESEVPTEPAEALAGDTARLAGQGRHWLAQRCLQAGATLQACAVYRRLPPQPDAALLRQVAAHPQAVWLFSSSEALEHARALPLDLPTEGAAAVVSHPRIAARAQALGWRVLATVKPTREDLLLALECLETRHD